MVDALRPILTNRSEIAADSTLVKITAANGDRLHAKVPLAEIIDIDVTEVRKVADKRFMLMASFDFVITRQNRPLFAVEIDGRHHSQDLQSFERDRKKDAISETVGLPMLRVSSDLALLRNGRRTILEYVVDSYYLFEAFFSAQEAGTIPWDEPFARSSIVETLPEGEVIRGLDAKTINYLAQCEHEGKIPNRVPDTFVIRVPNRRNVRCLAYLAVAPDRFIRADVQVRDFRFVGLTPGELAETLAVIEIGRIVEEWVVGDAPVAINRLRLARDFEELQHGVDDGHFVSAVSFSANAETAGGLPPLTVQLGRPTKG